METGQGCMTSLLILLCAVGNCQSNLLTSSILPHSAEFGAPPLQTSFSVADTIATDSLVLPTAFAPTTRESISSTGSVSLNAYNIVESSSFVVPTVTFYATPAVDAELTTFLQSALDIPSRFIGVSATPRLFQTVWEDPSEVQAIPTTAFLDSVAVSRRWDPVEGQGAGELSDVQSWTTADVGTSTADVGVDKSSGRSDVIATSPTRSDHDGLMHSSSTVPAVLSSKPQGKLPSSLHVPTLSTATDMLDMNVTQAFLLYSSAGETSTDPLFSSPSVVSSPSSDGVNSSCSDSDSGCVENGGDGDEEEEIRLKVIIGVACGAVLLVVIFGVFIGCVLRRRGKMASGSKIDLSSYWDDSVTLSYINGHIDIPKDSADEMISLDNDSFLNSLDSMSFTNTWTSDTSRHTNF